MRPLQILKNTKEFLEQQQRGFEELAGTHPHAAEALQAAADEFRQKADDLGPLFAVLEQAQVVLHHVRATLDAAVVVALEAEPDHVGLKRVAATLDQVLPYARD